jgi:RHS repeat-associated protein
VAGREVHARSRRRVSTRYLTDAAGQAPSALRFDAYGNETARSGGKDPTAFQYAGAWGYRRDGDLGLDLLHHRWYDPAVGRFLTRDPIRWAGGLNLYGYCGGDPVNGVDPWGLEESGTESEDEQIRNLRRRGPRFFQFTRKLGDAAQVAVETAASANPVTAGGVAIDKARKGDWGGAALMVLPTAGKAAGRLMQGAKSWCANSLTRLGQAFGRFPTDWGTAAKRGGYQVALGLEASLSDLRPPDRRPNVSRLEQRG